MAKSIKKLVQEKLDGFKKALQKAVNAGNKQRLPQLILQPVQNKKYLRGTDLR